MYLGKTEYKSDNMKMYRTEKAQGLHTMILLIEIFTDITIKCFGF